MYLFPATFCFNEREIFSIFNSRKAMEILSREQVRGREAKM